MLKDSSCSWCRSFSDKVSASVDVVSGVPQACVLEQLLSILYTSKLFSKGTIWWAMLMILPAMQSFLECFRILK